MPTLTPSSFSGRPCPAAPSVRPWSSRPVLTLDRGRPWVYGPITSPGFTDREGRTVVPRRQIRELRALVGQVGPFTELAIAHELDPTRQASGLLDALRAGPRICTDDVAAALIGPLPPRPAVRRAARALELAVCACSSAVARSADTLLDPIIFGVRGDPELVDGRDALWFPLAAWRW